MFLWPWPLVHTLEDYTTVSKPSWPNTLSGTPVLALVLVHWTSVTSALWLTLQIQLQSPLTYHWIFKMEASVPVSRQLLWKLSTTITLLPRRLNFLLWLSSSLSYLPLCLNNISLLVLPSQPILVFLPSSLPLSPATTLVIPTTQLPFTSSPRAQTWSNPIPFSKRAPQAHGVGI